MRSLVLIPFSATLFNMLLVKVKNRDSKLDSFYFRLFLLKPICLIVRVTHVILTGVQ